MTRKLKAVDPEKVMTLVADADIPPGKVAMVASNPDRCMCSHLKRSHSKGGCTMTSGFLTGGECDCVKFRPEEFAS